ncbi:MAG: metallophosphoesterase [Bacteroidales bacterium]|nr:metallophosphoesterase [Bacteroidales bacterium]
MKPCILGFLLILAAACQPFKPFTFVQMSDTQIGFIDPSAGFVHSDSLMKAAVAAANALHPAYVFITGDLVDNPFNAVQDSIYRTRVAEVQAPVYAVPGNHDYYGFSRERQQAYIALRGYDRFSFRERGCAFIGMDSNCIKDGAEEAEAEQRAWLEKELQAARGCRYTFVFLHCPVIREAIDEPEDYFNFSADKRRQYIDLFKANGVDVVFAGHTHEDYDCTVEGLRFVTAGPVGNALGHGVPGYNVIRVSKQGIDVAYTRTIASPAI